MVKYSGAVCVGMAGRKTIQSTAKVVHFQSEQLFYLKQKLVYFGSEWLVQYASEWVVYYGSEYPEFPIFIKNLHKTSYIGEVGMDFSREGISTKEVQLNSFSRILDEIKEKKKILSIHSRRAEREIINLLIEKQILAGIFHWYSGPLRLIDKIGQAGFYFSVNPMMTRSLSGKSIIGRIPREKILSETDGPFTSINGLVLKPKDCIKVIDYLSEIWQINASAVESQLQENFKKLLSLIA
ncbi:TatD DNase family protein [Pedobacter sp. UYP30]|uniref:TatD family hydrolase n=1 Tax=Pedobacter sp. UYP30 TaxID=1756400 RepID=UPI00339B0B85